MRLKDLNVGDEFLVVGDMTTYMLCSAFSQRMNPVNTRNVVVTDGGVKGRLSRMAESRTVIPIVPVEQLEVKSLERHRYAPELNKLHVIRKGEEVALSVPGQTSIEAAIRYLGKQS